MKRLGYWNSNGSLCMAGIDIPPGLAKGAPTAFHHAHFIALA